MMTTTTTTVTRARPSLQDDAATLRRLADTVRRTSTDHGRDAVTRARRVAAAFAASVEPMARVAAAVAASRAFAAAYRAA